MASNVSTSTTNVMFASPLCAVEMFIANVALERA